MVNARLLENKGGEYWTDAAVALIMGGGKICIMYKIYLPVVYKNYIFLLCRNTNFN